MAPVPVAASSAGLPATANAASEDAPDTLDDADAARAAEEARLTEEARAAAEAKERAEAEAKARADAVAAEARAKADALAAHARARADRIRRVAREITPARLKQMITTDPEIVRRLTALGTDPGFVQKLTDPAALQGVATGDGAALGPIRSDPRVAAIIDLLIERLLVAR